MSGKRLDFTHIIHHLSFGDDAQMDHIKEKFGDTFSFDLDNTYINQAQFLYQGQLLANYYLDVNEIDYVDMTEKEQFYIYAGYKHRTSRSLLAQLGLPAIFFRYELSPVKLQYTITYQAWSTFLTKICAIIGGLFTVAGILESVLRNSLNIVHFSDSSSSSRHVKNND